MKVRGLNGRPQSVEAIVGHAWLLEALDGAVSPAVLPAMVPAVFGARLGLTTLASAGLGNLVRWVPCRCSGA